MQRMACHQVNDGDDDDDDGREGSGWNEMGMRIELSTDPVNVMKEDTQSPRRGTYWPVNQSASQ